jgi:predicted metalloprotease
LLATYERYARFEILIIVLLRFKICSDMAVNWMVCVQDHGKWRYVIEKAKTLIYEVVTPREEEGM